MKKYASIVVILIIVVLAHIFFLRPLISQRPEAKPEAREPQAEKVPEISPPTYKTASKNPRFGKLFDYRKAVWGDKLPVANCKMVKTGILADLDTHKVLWAKNPRTEVPIASMTKMMTLLLAFEAMDERPGLDLDTPVKVTRAAYRIGGSQVYLDPKETHPFGELLKSMAVKSANDSAYLVGEYVGNGSMELFVSRMNKRAYELKMASTNFVNVHGLTIDKKSSTSCPEGLTILAENLLQYPILIEWTSTREGYFRPEGDKNRQFMTNTNKLLGKCTGVDGIKTGYTKDAGFCITASCLRGGKRLVAVVTGFKSAKLRNDFVAKLLAWGYQKAFEPETKSAGTKPQIPAPK
ncbi:MAG: D-alanyl-D-alanine carboxypeptidase [Victivallaceae bacterium]|nr:D-alanyl-D-alanine carboxypeptidase [Victivallaceae bacterium]